MSASPTAVGGDGHRDFECRERGAAVAVGQRDEVIDRVLVRLRLLALERVHEDAEVVFTQRLEPKDGRPADERRVDFEERILRRRADQGEDPRFDGREQRVLLGLVEPMHLVKKEDGAAATIGEPAPCSLDHFAHVLDARGHRRQRDELARAVVRDHRRERGLSRARRTPQDDRAQPVGLDKGAKGRGRTEQVVLPDNVIDRLGPHARGERRLLCEPLVERAREQVVIAAA